MIYKTAGYMKMFAEHLDNTINAIVRLKSSFLFG